MSDLSSYLQRKYLSKPEKSKKVKKEQKSKRQKLNQDIIIEASSFPISNSTPEKDTSQTSRTVSEPTLTTIPKKKGWKVVGTDEIIDKRDAAVQVKAPEAPEAPEAEAMMASGAKAGLQTAEQVAAQIRAKEEAEKEYLETQTQESMGATNETVHRDASGRKINIEQLKEHERQNKRLEKEEKERKKREMNMGLVQKLQMQQNKANLEKINKSGLARYSNDVELNQEQKRKELDDDPMLSFNPRKKFKYVSLTGRKLYRGGFPENRFGIVPGYRWDGVDRSNGFEKKWFKAQQEKQRQKTLSYTMQEDEL